MSELTWPKVRERIRGLGEPIEDCPFGDGPFTAEQVADALTCADALEELGLPPPLYAWKHGDRFTFGWCHKHGVEFRSDGTCSATRRTPLSDT